MKSWYAGICSAGPGGALGVCRRTESFAPLGLVHLSLSTHGLRRGLHSHAAWRLMKEIGSSPLVRFPSGEGKSTRDSRQDAGATYWIVTVMAAPAAGADCMPGSRTPPLAMVSAGLSGGFGHQGQSHDRALSGNSACARWARRGNLQGSGGVIVAMNQGYGLAVMGKETSVRNVDHLQHLRIVADLQGHGICILGAGEHHIHCESRALGLGGAAGSKLKAARARRTMTALRCLAGRLAPDWPGWRLRWRLSRGDWSNRRRRILMAHPAQLNGVGGAYVQRPPGSCRCIHGRARCAESGRRPSRFPSGRW